MRTFLLLTSWKFDNSRLSEIVLIPPHLSSFSFYWWPILQHETQIQQAADAIIICLSFIQWGFSQVGESSEFYSIGWLYIVFQRYISDNTWGNLLEDSFISLILKINLFSSISISLSLTKQCFNWNGFKQLKGRCLLVLVLSSTKPHTLKKPLQ